MLAVLTPQIFISWWAFKKLKCVCVCAGYKLGISLIFSFDECACGAQQTYRYWPAFVNNVVVNPGICLFYFLWQLSDKIDHSPDL